MDTIVGGGRSLLALQALFGGAIYVVGFLCDVRVGELSLSIAGLVAALFMLTSIYHIDLISTSIAGASLSVVIVLLSASVGSYSATGICFFFMLVFAMIAARLAQQESGGVCHFSTATLFALPVVGVLAVFIFDGFGWLYKRRPPSW